MVLSSVDVFSADVDQMAVSSVDVFSMEVNPVVVMVKGSVTVVPV